jgi:HSP20 family protein
MDPLTRWNQLRWNELNEREGQRHISDELFSRSRGWRPGGGTGGRSVARWVTLVDVSENDQGYWITVELPQVKKEDVQISLEDGTLTITGTRKFERNRPKERQVEPADGSFIHRFSLPKDTEPADGTAEFEDGVLTVHLAKNAKDRVRHGEVEAAVNDPIAKDESGCSGWGINK